MFSIPQYIYRAELVRVIDGDTVDIKIDLGFNITALKRIRISMIDTDEPRGGTLETKAKAKAATMRMEELLAMGPLYVKTYMDAEGKYGRVLGDLFVEMESSAIDLIDARFIDVSTTLLVEGYSKGNTSPPTENIQYI